MKLRALSHTFPVYNFSFYIRVHAARYLSNFLTKMLPRPDRSHHLASSRRGLGTVPPSQSENKKTQILEHSEYLQATRPVVVVVVVVGAAVVVVVVVAVAVGSRQ